MKAAVKILSLGIVFFSAGTINAQSRLYYNQKTNQSLITKKVYNFNSQDKIFFSSNTLSSREYNFKINRSLFKIENLALFCKIEEKVARKSNLQMRLRLGSLEYVNYLEQKPLSKTDY